MVDTEDLEVTFHVIGTSIREDSALADQQAMIKPLSILSLR